MPNLGNSSQNQTRGTKVAGGWEPPEQFFVTVGDDGAARLWEIRFNGPGTTVTLVGVARGHGHIITHADVTPDGKTLVTGALDGSVMITDLDKLRRLYAVDPIGHYASMRPAIDRAIAPVADTTRAGWRRIASLFERVPTPPRSLPPPAPPVQPAPSTEPRPDAQDLRNVNAARATVEQARRDYAADPVDWRRRALASWLIELGKSLRAEGQSTEATAVFREATTLLEPLTGPDRVPVDRQAETLFAESLRGEGAALRNLGNLAGSEQTVRRAVSAAERGAGVESSQVSRALTDLGEIFRDQGRLDESIASLRRADAIVLKVLGADHPERLSITSAIGDVMTAQGNLAIAMESYRVALSLAERLAATEPGNIVRQREFSATHSKIGDIHFKQGNAPAALNSFRRSLLISQRVATSDAGDFSSQRDIAVTRNRIGDVLRMQGNLMAALEDYRTAQAIFDRHANIEPANTGLRRDLSISHARVADVLREQGNSAAALDSYRTSLAIVEQLASADPGNAGWQRDLSITQSKVGDLLATQGNAAEASTAYEKATAIAERLAIGDPANATWQRDAAALRERRAALSRSTSLASAFRRLDNRFVLGDGYRATSGGNYESCAMSCQTDNQCRMFEFYFGPEANRGKCNLFAHVRVEAAASQVSHVGIKQPEAGGTQPASGQRAIEARQDPSGVRSASRGLVPIRTTGSTVVIVSDENGRAPSDGKGSSPFTTELLRQLDLMSGPVRGARATPTVDRLARDLRDGVTRASRGEQTPAIATGGSVNFSLVGGSPGKSRREALVIANTTGQQGAALSIADGRGIADRFKRLGYVVSTVKSPGRQQLRQALERLALRSGEPDDVTVIYFSGGVLNTGGRNVLMPADAVFPLIAQDLEGVGLDEVLEVLERRGGNSVVFLDIQALPEPLRR